LDAAEVRAVRAASGEWHVTYRDEMVPALALNEELLAIGRDDAEAEAFLTPHAREADNLLAALNLRNAPSSRWRR
jgi:DNA-directed RNA polymerase specialized sigma54-like protein